LNPVYTLERERERERERENIFPQHSIIKTSLQIALSVNERETKQKKSKCTKQREVACIRTKLKLQISVASGESASFGKME